MVFLCKSKMLHKKPVKQSYCVMHVHFINIFTMLHNNCTFDVWIFWLSDGLALILF